MMVACVIEGNWSRDGNKKGSQAKNILKIGTKRVAIESNIA